MQGVGGGGGGGGGGGEFRPFPRPSKKDWKAIFLAWPIVKGEIKLYMWGDSLNYLLSHSVAHARGNLEKSGNINARTLKFDM